MRSPTVVSNVVLCIVHLSEKKILRLCVTGSPCGQAQALYQQAWLYKRPIYRQWPLLVRAALYDKPYARKVKKYSYWYVGPPFPRCSEIAHCRRTKFAFIASH